MANFNDTAIEALDKLNSAVEKAKQTKAKIAEFETQLSSIEQQVETDGREIEEKARQLLQQIAGTRKSMAADANLVVQTLVQFRTNIESIENQLNIKQQETQTEITSFSGAIDRQQPKLATKSKTTARSLSALKESFNMMTEEVAETSSEFQELLSEDFSHAIEELESDLIEGSESAIDGMSESVIPSLEEIGTDFETGLNETIESVADAVQRLTQESQAASQELMAEVTNICEVYQTSFDDEQEAFAEFTEKLADVFTQEGVAKINEVFQSGLLENIDRDREKTEKIVELLSKVRDKLEEFI